TGSRAFAVARRIDVLGIMIGLGEYGSAVIVTLVAAVLPLNADTVTRAMKSPSVEYAWLPNTANLPESASTVPWPVVPSPQAMVAVNWLFCAFGMLVVKVASTSLSTGTFSGKSNAS